MVFAGLYPVIADDYEDLRDAVDKLRLNDASFTFEPESSGALGFGFRCGFLGLLHMEIIQERLEREFDLDLITTAPGRALPSPTRPTARRSRSTAPRKLPDPGPARLPGGAVHPVARSSPAPSTSGGILALAEERRGDAAEPAVPVHRPGADRVRLPARRGDPRLLRQAEVGLARLRLVRLRAGRLPAERRWSKLDILVNGEPVDALSLIVHRDKAYPRGKALVEKMKELIPRQLSRSCSRPPSARGSSPARPSGRSARTSSPSATAATSRRKRKLLEKQKEGKKRMKRVGRVDIPQEAFLAVLRVD